MSSTCLAWLIVGCGGDDAMVITDPEPLEQGCTGACDNRAAPFVAEYSPRDCIDGPCPAAPDAQIRIRFSEAIDPLLAGGGMASCLGEVSLMGAEVDASTGPCLSGTVALAPDGVVLTLTPDVPLFYGARYRVRVDGSVHDLSGQPLGTPFSWEFSTQQAPVCGNGELSADETCDDGNLDGGDYCSADCQQIIGSCADGVVQATMEDCDDGNGDPGDGCSPRCLQEFRERRVLPGDGHSCGIRRDGTVLCWGRDATPAPEGSFRELAVGADFACALDRAGALRCWGSSTLSRPGPYDTISAGGDHVCVGAAGGALSCIEASSGAAALIPPGELAASYVRVGWGWACALDSAGSPTCWGPAAVHPPAGLGGLSEIVVGAGFGCGLDAAGEISCFGGSESDVGLRMPPAGPHAALGAGETDLCAMSPSGSVTCWRVIGGAALMPGSGGFVRMDMGPRHACGIRGSDEAACWGDEGADAAAVDVPAAF